MKKVVITLIIISASISAYCQHPYKQDLGSVAQATFPDTPKIEYPGGAIYYVFRDKSNDIYFSQVIDLKKINPDSLDLTRPNNIYSQFINSVLKPLHGHVFHVDTIELNRLKGISFTYKCDLNGNIYYGYNHVFHINNTIVSCSLLSPDSLRRDDKKLTTFFSSFILTPKRAADLDKTSSIFAGVIMISSIIFIGSLAIFLIKRSNKKKTYTWPEEGQ